MFISQAYAQAASAPAMSDTNSLFMNIAPILIIFVIFYFLVIRPQSKKIKAHQEMLNELKKGDQVVTGGGFLGNVVNVSDDNIVTVDLGNGMTVRALKHTLSGLQQTATLSGPVLQDNKPKKTL
jgi:preprotein translocase subunit YajC